MDSSSILVTGGAGYIGSHVCRALQQRGYLPVTLDNLSTGHRDLVRFGPLAEGDIGDADLVRALCAQYKPQAVLHLAAFSEVGESIKFPERYMRNNCEQARAFFGAIQERGIRHAVFSGTAAIYGMPEKNIPLKETLPPKPINPYGESKLETEQYLLGAGNIRCVSLRYFNAAGAAEDAAIGEAHWPETHLVPNALLCALGYKKEPLTIYGSDYPTPDGTPVRDYIHVEDLADAHIRAFDYLLQGGVSEAINLGSGHGQSVKEVIDAIGRITGKTLPVTAGSRRAGDPPFLVADISKAADILGWQPKRGLDAMISSAFAWHGSAEYRKLVGLA